MIHSAIFGVVCAVASHTIKIATATTPPIPMPVSLGTRALLCYAFFAYAFFNPQGEFVGTILDLIRRMWLTGEIPAEIGLHPIKVEIPEDWHRYVQGQEEAPIHEIRATIRVVGLLVALSGTAKAHVLFDPETKQVDRGRLEAAFSGPQSTLPVTTFSSEESLASHLEKHGKADLHVKISRLRLPRILGRSGYWPPSQKAIDQIKKSLPDCPGKEGRG